jgi:hypothetical protein
LHFAQWRTLRFPTLFTADQGVISGLLFTFRMATEKGNPEIDERTLNQSRATPPTEPVCKLFSMSELELKSFIGHFISRAVSAIDVFRSWRHACSKPNQPTLTSRTY